MIRFLSRAAPDLLEPVATAARLLLVAGLGTLVSVPAVAQTGEDPGGGAQDQVSFFADWALGPTTGDLSNVAQIAIPENYLFGDGDQARELLELFENPTNGTELGCLTPAVDEESWYVFFEFDNIGYVKDDERDSLEPDAMLSSIRESTEQANELRRKKGWSTVDIVGWMQPPHYDLASNNLEWAIEGISEGHRVVNYNTRVLGRRGVMSVSLLVDPEDVERVLPTFKSLLRGFDFKSGHRYGEFVQGDKVAKYGLSALVVGGAAAVAAKTGLLAKFWKLLVVGFMALVGMVRRLFGGRGKRGPPA